MYEARYHLFIKVLQACCSHSTLPPPALKSLDFARVYDNQKEIGEALKQVVPSVVKREELFLTSKLWCISHKQDQVLPALEETLEQLGLDYLDLYLIHVSRSSSCGESSEFLVVAWLTDLIPFRQKVARPVQARVGHGALPSQGRQGGA